MAAIVQGFLPLPPINDIFPHFNFLCNSMKQCTTFGMGASCWLAKLGCLTRIESSESLTFPLRGY